MPEDVAVALVDSISKPVSEKRVVCQALGFLDKQAEGECGGCVEW